MARAKNCSGKKKKSLLPKWDLSDLYKGTDSLVLKSDLKRARKATLTFRKHILVVSQSYQEMR